MTKQTLTNFLSRNFGAQSGHTCKFSLYRAVRAPIGTRALRLQPHQPHGWSGPVDISFSHFTRVICQHHFHLSQNLVSYYSKFLTASPSKSLYWSTHQSTTPVICISKTRRWRRLLKGKVWVIRSRRRCCHVWHMLWRNSLWSVRLCGSIHLTQWHTDNVYLPLLQKNTYDTQTFHNIKTKVHWWAVATLATSRHTVTSCST